MISNKLLKIKGPKGESEVVLEEGVKAKKIEDKIVLESPRRKRQQRINFGLNRAKLANAVKGVSTGFSKVLELFGVGYAVAIEGDHLNLSLGYSHPIKLKKPEGIEVEIKKNEITVSGIDREKVGQFAAKMRDFKRVEPYKGKGFRYNDEIVRHKIGKAALKTESEGAK